MFTFIAGDPGVFVAMVNRETSEVLFMRPSARNWGPTELLVGIVVVVTASFSSLAFSLDEKRRGLDDAYITYRYAQNIATGHGFVFNPSERQPTLGTSTPLYTALLAASALLGMDIPSASIMLGTLATSVTLALVVCLAWEFHRVSAGIIVGLVASVAQLYWNWEGMETQIVTVDDLLGDVPPPAQRPQISPARVEAVADDQRRGRGGLVLRPAAKAPKRESSGLSKTASFAVQQGVVSQFASPGFTSLCG